MQLPVSFYKDPACDSRVNLCLSIYEQVHNASIFSLFLPAANVADVTRAMGGRNYGDTGFYHTLLMSNHMESDPEQFADGIRGKVLWHNEYRMEPMYDARNAQVHLAQGPDVPGRLRPAEVQVRPRRRPRSTTTPATAATCATAAACRSTPRASSTRRMTKEFMAGQRPTSRTPTAESAKDYTFTGHDPTDEARVLRPAARSRAPELVELLGAPQRFDDGPRRTRRVTRHDQRPLLQQQDHELLRRQLPRVAAGRHHGLQLRLELRARRREPDGGQRSAPIQCRAQQARRTSRCRSSWGRSRRRDDCQLVVPAPTDQAVADDVRRHRRYGHPGRDQAAVQVGYMHLERQAPRQPRRDRGDPQRGDHGFPQQPGGQARQRRRRDRLEPRGRATASPAR